MTPATVLIIIVILTIFGSLWLLYQSTVLGECKRNIENSLLPLQLEIKANDEILAESKQDLQTNSNNFLKAQFNQRARTVPIEAIKEVRATKVRISLLQSAGYRTPSDLTNVDMNQLRRIRGI